MTGQGERDREREGEGGRRERERERNKGMYNATCESEWSLLFHTCKFQS